MNRTEVYIVRHGETAWNADGRFQGHQDSPLTAMGIRQAEALADRLINIEFAALYSSDLGRAYQTAEIIARRIGHEIITDPRLRERKYGIFEGLTRGDVEERYPEAFRQFKKNPYRDTVPGAEPIHEIARRAIECLNELAEKHTRQRILVVTHGGIISRFLRVVLGIPLETPRKFRVANAGINIFSHKKETWRLETLGDLSFLNEG